MISIGEMAEQAKAQLAAITGLDPVEVVGISRGDQRWQVQMEMLELTRIPSSADVIAEYEALLDDEGNLLEFHRKRSRLRGQPVDEVA